jgi:putative acetyltransferase
MNIRRGTPPDADVLVDLWLRSVRATHTFLTEKDIQRFLPFVQEELASDKAEIWVLQTEHGEAIGFMELSGNKMEALFLAPEHHRRGGGRQLVHHAQQLRGELTVDVNEQNPAARRFYEACGFISEGRSERDGMGLPFPLVHMRLKASKDADSRRETP